jgi:hypothetical protein
MRTLFRYYFPLRVAPPAVAVAPRGGSGPDEVMVLAGMPTRPTEIAHESSQRRLRLKETCHDGGRHR